MAHFNSAAGTRRHRAAHTSIAQAARLVIAANGIRLAVHDGVVLASLQDLQWFLRYATSTSSSSRFRALFRNNGTTLDSYATRIAIGANGTWFINEDGLRFIAKIISADKAKALTDWLASGAMSIASAEAAPTVSEHEFEALRRTRLQGTEAAAADAQTNDETPSTTLRRAQHDLEARLRVDLQRQQGAALQHAEPQPTAQATRSTPAADRHKAYCRELARVLVRYATADEVGALAEQLEGQVRAITRSRPSQGLNDAAYAAFTRYMLA